MFQEGQQIGPYTLLERIGRGGFGEVWLAEKRSQLVTKKVAVKLPHPFQIDLDAIQQEATLWEAASGHPNVLPIIDAEVYDEQVVIVSEYADGGSLSDRLKVNGAFPVREAVEMTIGILNGLAFLHSKNIIHRDVKPANILLQGDMPRLADFGISRAIETATISSTIVGTESYMSPEAFEGKRTVQTDVWSVGVLLYHLLKGELPFPQKQATEMMYAVLLKEPEPLPESIPQELREIVFKALEKDTALDGNPPRRYQSAVEMREDLSNFLVAFLQTDLPKTIETTGKAPAAPNTSQPNFLPAKTEIAAMDEVETQVQFQLPMKASKPSKSFVQTLVNKKISPFGIASAILVIFLIGWLAMRLFNQSPAVEELTSFDHAHTAQSKVSPDSEIVTGGNSNDEETAVKVLEYFNQAAKFYQQKKYGKAIEAYTKAIELTPTDYSIYNNRGLVFHTMRDYDRAIADFDKSIEISPNSLTYNNRGVAREDRGDIEQAISDYRKALELDSSNEMANRNLNKILKRR